MRCPRCGAENQQDRTTCYICQARLTAQPFQQPQAFAPTGSMPNYRPSSGPSGNVGQNAVPMGPMGPDHEAPTHAWTPPNIGQVNNNRVMDTKPSPVHDYSGGNENATMAQSSPGIEDFGPLAQSLRSPHPASTHTNHPWSAPTQPAPSSTDSYPGSSPSHTGMQGVGFQQPAPKQPLGIPSSQPNLEQATQAQPQLNNPYGNEDNGEATIAGGPSPLNVHPSIANMPATMKTLDETTSISDPGAAIGPQVPQGLSIPSAVPTTDKPTRPVAPPTPEPPIKASMPPQSASAPRLPVVDEVTSEMPDPPKPPASFAQEVTQEKTVSSSDRLPQASSSDALPRLPRPKLPENFVFAAKAEIPGIWVRGLAGFIDMALLLGLTYMITKMAGPKVTYTFPEGMHIVNMVTIGLQKYQTALLFGAQVFAGLYVVYSTLLHALGGKSIGKRLLSLKVVSHTGKPMGWFGSFARSIAFLLFTALNLIGLFWILFDREYKSLHDKVSGSIVVKDNPAYPLPK